MKKRTPGKIATALLVTTLVPRFDGTAAAGPVLDLGSVSLYSQLRRCQCINDSQCDILIPEHRPPHAARETRLSFSLVFCCNAVKKFDTADPARLNKKRRET